MAASPKENLKELEEELSLLKNYPKKNLEEIIKEVGFSCTCCGKCCTKAFNGHVFLLSADAKRLKEFSPESLMPAPDFPYSDPSGNFYVSGYALKTKENGDCVFLDENNRCKIYDQRFTICRVYPYMLHREPDARGKIDWRQISGLGEHGSYDCPISDEECAQIAGDTISYEAAYLEQEIEFHKAVIQKFADEKIRFVRKDHDRRVHEFLKTGRAVVYVWDGSSLVKEEV
ncbi:MAG: YkgJ family cysteine cluster protein [Methanocorpusculum sp.]|jgi:Fe-S-cluster containining protein|nr:YkgJ family cysteine cluster protein [Methanocorpusculum sp.]MDD2470491.1 YkgJ family cysteine cluster protein [Methanocorpusculum sp.]MDD3257153.1 YkgJ family cysteine cluster protein [Methanocorpusculum sp.]